ncbi:MAG: glycosyltransferase family 117 protein [Anaerolineae bacterium]
MKRETPPALLDALPAGMSALLAFLLYLRTLAPGLLGGDSGEFQFAAWLGGFAHPTGYPLYLLMGRLWTHLVPFGDPAWRMNLLSAIWAAVAVGLFYLLARQVLALVVRSGPLACLSALAAAALFAATPTFWSQAVIAEVYTLNTALLVALLWALVRWAATGRMCWLDAAAVVFGLGLAHHRTAILWLPAIVLFGRLVGGEVAHRGEVWRKALALLLLAGLPLLLYAYIPLTAPQTPYMHVRVGPEQTLELYTPTIGGFLDYVAGRTFESEFRSPGEAAGRLLPEAARLPGELTWPGVALGALGLGWLARRSRPLLALTGIGFLTLFVFNLFYGIGDIAVYYIPLYLVWSLWIAAGAAGLGAAFAGRLSRPEVQRRGAENAEASETYCGLRASAVRSSSSAALARGRRRCLEIGRFLRLLPGLLVAVLPGLIAARLLISNYTRMDQSHNHQARATWQAILAREIPSNAILITNDRDEMMPFWYMQYVERVRPDLTGLFPLIRPGTDWSDVGATTASALRSGRPVLLIKEMPGLEVKFRLEPAGGGLVRVIGPAVEGDPQRPAATRFGDAIELVGYDIEPPLLSPGATTTVRLHWRPLGRLDRDYTTFVHLVNAEGRVIGASDHRPGGVYYPTSFWKSDETLVDAHTFTLAGDLGKPPYAVEVGLYTVGPALRHLGQPQRIGVVGRARPADRLPDDVAQRPDAIFGGQIALRGFATEWTGHRLTIHFYWQAVAAATADYTVFVHLLDANGKIAAQYDGQPAGGEFPTRAWPVGDLLADVVVLDLPTDLPAGVYRLVAGLYDATTGARLALGATADNSMLLGEIGWPAGR